MLAAAPRAHAQTDDDPHKPTDDWAVDGTVWVSVDAMNAATRPTLTIREGESGTYWVRLNKEPIVEATAADPWWVFVHVDGSRRADGQYEGIRWIPSIGRTFHTGDWSQWKSFQIYAEEDDDEQNETYTFTHELWDHDAYCPDALHPDNLPRVTVRVIDDDGPNAPRPELSIGDATVEEGGTARFEVHLDTASERAVTVRYRTSNGTALADSDYEPVDDEELEIPAETTRAIIQVQTTEDDAYEADETFRVTLSQPDRATIRDGTGEGTITDDDAPPRLSIGNATVEEGDRAEFEVTLTPESSLPVTVQYATMDVTAIDGSDYTGTSGGLTFPAGTTSRTIYVSTREDDVREPVAETFTVVLSQPEDATLDSTTGTGTINDDDQDAPPSLRIGDATVTEGGMARFEVSLSVPIDQGVTVEYDTQDGTARAGSDYTAKSSVTLTFPAQTMTRTIEVVTLHDQDYEGDEAFTVRLRNPSGATLDDATGTGTIQDDDSPGVSINNVTVQEGSQAEFTVTLAGPTNVPVTVAFATSDGSATAGVDYVTITSESLTISARETTATFSVETIDDEERESNEDFTVTVSNSSASDPSGRTDTGTGTITDNDGGGGAGAEEEAGAARPHVCPSETPRQRRVKRYSSPSP